MIFVDWHRSPYRHLKIIAPLIIFLAVTFIYFGNTPSWTKYYYGHTSDPLIYIWSLNWWPFALKHHLNPFICKYVWFPHGFNLTWATALPSLALISLPATLMGGPVLSYNLLTLAAPALAAWTSYLLAYELTQDWTAALIGGYLFGFCPFEIDTMMTALNLDMVCLIPFSVFLCLKYIKGKIGRKTFIIALALVLLAQLGISTEVLASFCLFSALSWALFLLLSSSTNRPRLLRLAVDIWIAVGLMSLLASPFIYYLVKGLPDVPPVIIPALIGSVDLLQYIIPAPIQHGWTMFSLFAHQFSALSPSNRAFLSLPMILAIAWYFFTAINHPYVRAFLATFCLLLIASLGPQLHWNGHITDIKLPWSLLLHVPIIRSIVPGRLTIYVCLCAALAMALWLSGASTRIGRVFRLAFGFSACFMLIPGRPVIVPPPWHADPFLTPSQHFMWSPWPTQSFFTPSHVRALLGSGTNIIILTRQGTVPSIAWQLNSGMSFTQSGGYIGFTPLSEKGFGPENLLTLPLGTNFRSVLADYCTTHHVNYILIGPDAPSNLAAAIAPLNWPTRTDHGVTIVTVMKSSESMGQ